MTADSLWSSAGYWRQAQWSPLPRLRPSFCLVMQDGVLHMCDIHSNNMKMALVYVCCLCKYRTVFPTLVHVIKIAAKGTRHMFSCFFLGRHRCEACLSTKIACSRLLQSDMFLLDNVAVARARLVFLHNGVIVFFSPKFNGAPLPRLRMGARVCCHVCLPWNGHSSTCN